MLPTFKVLSLYGRAPTLDSRKLLTSLCITVYLVHFCELKYRCARTSSGPISCNIPMRMSSGSCLCHLDLFEIGVKRGKAVPPSAPCRKHVRRFALWRVEHVLQHVLVSTCDLVTASPRELSPSVQTTIPINSYHKIKPSPSASLLRAACSCALNSLTSRNDTVRSVRVNSSSAS